MKNLTLDIRQTNDPTVVKFVANQILTDTDAQTFDNVDEAKASPILKSLFYLPFVKKVQVNANFIAIQRYDIVEWKDVQEEVKEQLITKLSEADSLFEEIEETTATSRVFTLYAETTPNPNVMKYVSSQLLYDGMLEFKNNTQASHSPLAQFIFGFPFVKEVFISNNYISVTKTDVVEWQEVFADLRDQIRIQLTEGLSVLESDGSELSILSDDLSSEQGPDDLPVPSTPLRTEFEGVEKEIAQLLEEYITPAVASDGGNIALHHYDEDTKHVHVLLQGACSGCPSSTVTLRQGIEGLLKEMLPNKVEAVVAI